MNCRSRSKYQKLFVWWSNVERRIKGLLMLFFALLVLTQFALTNQPLSKLLNRVERFEGTAILESEKAAEIGSIELQRVNTESSPALIYINGEKAGTLDGNSIRLNIRNNDVLEISGINCKSNVNIRVVSCSENIIRPEEGKIYETDGRLITVGQIKIK